MTGDGRNGGTPTAPAADRRPGVLVAGLGSPHGDDVVGWRVVEVVADRRPDVPVVRAGAPGTLLPGLADAVLAVVVDAAEGIPAGAVVELPPERLRRGPAALSSHGVGLAEVLETARAAGRLRAAHVLGVGVDAAWCEPGMPASDGLDAVAARAAARVLELLARLGRSGGGPGRA